MKRVICLAAVLSLAMAGAGPAMRVSLATAEEATRMGEAWVKNHPKDAEGYFFLGRIYGMQWVGGPAVKVNLVSVGAERVPPRFPPFDTIIMMRDPAKQATPEALQCLGASIAGYRNALEIDPKNPLYQMGLAWALEQLGKAGGEMPADAVPAHAQALDEADRSRAEAAIKLLGDSDFGKREAAGKTLFNLMPQAAGLLLAVKTDDPEVTLRVAALLHTYWLQKALELYRAAYEETLDHDLKEQKYDDWNDAMISVEAGTQMLAIFKDHPEFSNAEEIRKIQEAVKTLTAKDHVLHAL